MRCRCICYAFILSIIIIYTLPHITYQNSVIKVKIIVTIVIVTIAVVS